LSYGRIYEIHKKTKNLN